MAVKNTDRMLDLSRDLLASGVPKYGVGGRRNLIINGAMQVAQRGTQLTGITTFGYHTVDRIRFGGPYATSTMDQNTVTDLPGFAKSCKVTCTTAGTPTALQTMNISTRLEAQNLQHLKKGTSDAESLTLSFWVKSNKTGTYTSEIYEDDNARSISATYTIDTADTWEYKTVTFPGDTTGVIANDDGIGFYVSWFLGAGSDFTAGTFNTSWNNYVVADRISSAQVQLGDTIGQYFEITGVQLELGDTATPFEHRSYGEELALCQRYFCKTRASVRGTASGGSQFWENQIYWPQEMRAAPTTTISGNTPTNGSVVTASETKFGARFSFTTSSSGGFYALNNTVKADAEL